MELLQLQNKIKETLESNSFKIINDVITKDKFILVSNFGVDLEQSTFYINKEHDIDNMVIGAHVTLDTKIITKLLLNRIQVLSANHNISCSPVKYDNDKGIGTLSLYMIYKYYMYDEENFMLYVNNFKNYIISLYNDIDKYIQYQNHICLDLSMFDGADWSVFDPYVYIMERDVKFDGSWDAYIQALKKNLNKKEKLAELIYVEMCKNFEDINSIPIEMACDYIIEQVQQYNEKNKNGSVVN